MKIISFLALAVVLGPAAAGDPPGVVHWTSADLKGYEKKLAPKINAQKVSSEQLGRFGNHLFMIAHREGNGEAELHETQADPTSSWSRAEQPRLWLGVKWWTESRPLRARCAGPR